MKKTSTIIAGIFGTFLLSAVMAFTPFQNSAACALGLDECDAYRQWCVRDTACGKLKTPEERDSCKASNPKPKKPEKCSPCATAQ